MRFINFLKTNDQVKYKIQYFIRDAQKDGHNIKVVMTDNGREFKNRELSDWLRDQGIAEERSAAYCPEMNGLIERDNRTILEGALSLMYSASNQLQNVKPLWSEAMNYMVYVLNRTINKNLEMTPFEHWYG